MIDRYQDPRRLRTRAAGTPFWVRADTSGITITPGSGIERHVVFETLAACWPYIARGEPVSIWRAKSAENSSYLSAIFDDLVDSLGATDSHDAAVGTAAAGHADDTREPDLAIAEMQARLAAAEREIRRLYAAAENPQSRQLDFDAALAIGLRDERIRDLEAGRVATHPSTCAAGARVEALERDLAALRASGADQERVISSLRASLEKAREAERALTDEASRLRSDLETAKADVLKAVAKARARGRSLAPTPPAPTPVYKLKVDLGGLDGALRSHAIDPEVGQQLRQSASYLASDPDTAVMRCRRALEGAVSGLWQQANASSHVPGVGIGQLLSDLRDHPLLGTSDWHLAKNLYARSSAIVHEGGATPDLALWIWLGVLQFAEIAHAEPVPPVSRIAAGRPN